MVFGNMLGNFSLLDLLVTKTAGNYFGKVDLPNMSFHVCLQRKLFLAYYTWEQFPSCILLCGSHFAYFGCDRTILFLHSTISVCIRVPFLSKTCLGEVFSVLFLKVSLEVCHRSHLEDRENTNLLKGPNQHCIHFNIMLNINL